MSVEHKFTILSNDGIETRRTTFDSVVNGANLYFLNGLVRLQDGNNYIYVRLTENQEVFLFNNSNITKTIQVVGDSGTGPATLGYNQTIQSLNEDFVYMLPNEIIMIKCVNPANEGLTTNLLTNYYKYYKVVHWSSRYLDASIHERYVDESNPILADTSILTHPYFNLIRIEQIQHTLTATSGLAKIAAGGTSDIYNFKVNSLNNLYSGDRALPFGNSQFPFPFTHLSLVEDENLYTSMRVTQDFNPYLEYADTNTSRVTTAFPDYNYNAFSLFSYNLDAQAVDPSTFIYRQLKNAAETMCKYLRNFESAIVSIIIRDGNMNGGTLDVTKRDDNSADFIVANNTSSTTVLGTYTFSNPVPYTAPPSFTTLDVILPIPNVPSSITKVRVLKTNDGTLTPIDPQPSGYPLIADAYDTTVAGSYLESWSQGVFTVQLPSLSEYLVQLSIYLISEICFASETLIKTDQGHVAIEKLDKDVHTIRGKQIQAITETVMITEYLVRFEKDTFGKNIPSQETIMSPNHKVFYQGTLIPAKQFVGNVDDVSTVPYNNEPLYNILLDEYEKVIANNMVCETLDPNNVISTFFKALDSLKQNVTVRDKMIEQYNKSTLAIEN